MSQLQGRKILVTGAADGIGRGIAERFSDEGADVLAVDLADDKLAEAFDARPRVATLCVDLTADKAPGAIAEACAQRLGGLDILVNNAGIPGELALLEDCTDANWQKVFAVNVDAVFRISRACVPMLKRAGGRGRIITVASVCAEYGLRLQGPYVASKHAVAGLMKGFAIELGEYGVTANCINPANTVTGITRNWFAPADSPEGRAYLSAASVLGRYSLPADLAAAALFLAGDGGAYVTGQSITVDGGMTTRLPSLDHSSRMTED